jgi:carboxylate-amine ligase
MVEVCTGVCRNISEIEKDLGHTIRILETMAGEHECMIFASSLHPFSTFSSQQIFPDPRYAKILDELGIVGRRLITQGLHCHVGLEDEETAISVFDRLRPWLPLLLALSASSPFFDGVDTGFASYRSKLFDALPRSGIPQKLGSWQSYCDLVILLKRCGIIEAPRDIWWDVRPSPGFGTVEVRICDVPGRFKYIVALVALIQAMVAALASGRMEAPDTHIAVILSNKWQAARHGLQGQFVSQEHFSGKRMADRLLELFEELKPVFRELGSSDYLPVLREMVGKGPCSKKIRRLTTEKGDVREAIRRIQKDFWTETP